MRSAEWSVPGIGRPLLEGARRAGEGARHAGEEVRRTAERLRAARPSSMALPRLNMPDVARLARPGGWRMSLPSWPRLPRIASPGLGLAMAAGFAAVALVAVMVAVTLGGQLRAARLETERANAAAAETASRLATLQEAAAGADRTRSELQTVAQQAQTNASNVAGERDELRQRLDAASKQIADLQAKVTSASATADAQTQLAAQQKQQVRVLIECLSGTLVAVEFGRSGRWSAADRALAAVNDSCVAARALL